MNAKQAKYIRQQVRMARAVFGGDEDLIISKAVKRHWVAGTQADYAGDDHVLPFFCPCGTQVAMPSYSTRRQTWITAPHGITKTEFGPFKSRSGVIHWRPVALRSWCRGFERQDPEPEPEQPKEPTHEVGEWTPISL